MSTRDEAETAPLGGERPRDPADEARAKRELRARLFGPQSAETLPRDRYRLVRRIGQGGAGEVYEGWDVELGRRVAIKILHAVALSNLGLAYGTLGEHGDALSAFDEALSIRLELLGKEHIAVARTRSNRASVLSRLGRVDEAEAELRQALEVFETAMGPQSAVVGVVAMNLGDLSARRGDHEAAVDSYARALKIFEQHNDVDPDGLTKARLGVAQSQLAMGRHALAEAGLERVLLDGAPPELTASARLLLAEAIAADEPVRARDLASRARAWFSDRGDIAQVDAIDAMIDALPDAG